MNFETLTNILHMAPPLIVAVVLHEVAHGLMAEKLGDPTARKLKRITLNPIRHVDLFMTIILPLLLIISKSGIVFGGAKPVPVNPIYFKDPRKGMLWVALAGPVTNFVLAFLSYILLNILQLNTFVMPPSIIVNHLLIVWCAYSVLINVVLGTFNLLPIPPLDGGRIVVGILPEELAYKYAKIERYGFFIVIALIYYEIPQAVLEPLISWVLKLL